MNRIYEAVEELPSITRQPAD